MRMNRGYFTVVQGAQSVYQGANRGQPPGRRLRGVRRGLWASHFAILTITITADIWVETPPRQAGQRHLPPPWRGARPNAGLGGPKWGEPGDYCPVSS